MFTDAPLSTVRDSKPSMLIARPHAPESKARLSSPDPPDSATSSMPPETFRLSSPAPRLMPPATVAVRPMVTLDVPPAPASVRIAARPLPPTTLPETTLSEIVPEPASELSSHTPSPPPDTLATWAMMSPPDAVTRSPAWEAPAPRPMTWPVRVTDTAPPELAMSMPLPAPEIVPPSPRWTSRTPRSVPLRVSAFPDVALTVAVSWTVTSRSSEPVAESDLECASAIRPLQLKTPLRCAAVYS